MVKRSAFHPATALLFGVLLTAAVQAAVLPGNPVISRRAAAESMALLKNRNSTLPLIPADRVAAFGHGAVDFIGGGWGSGHVKTEYNANLNEALARQAEAGRIRYCPEAADAWGGDSKFRPDAAFVNHIRKQADTAVLVISRCSGESKDRSPGAGDWLLTVEEQELLQLLKKAKFRKLIVVLNTAGPVSTSELTDDAVDAILYASLPGMEGAHAAADLLTGTINPSGKLTDTWAVAYEDDPSSKDFIRTADFQEEEEDIFVGYRYFSTFDKEKHKVNFPFGHGLSYTMFEIAAPALSRENDTLVFRVPVTNIGDRSGREVVQLYVSAPQGKLGKPAMELAAFGKTRDLSPGERQELTLRVPLAQLASFDDTGRSGHEGCRVLEAGDYRFFPGNSSWDAIMHSPVLFRQEKLQIIFRASVRLKPSLLPRRLTADGSREALPVIRATAEKTVEIPHDRAIEIEAENFTAAHPNTGIEKFGNQGRRELRCVSRMDHRGRFVEYTLTVRQPGRYAIRFRVSNGRPALQDIMTCEVNGIAQPLRLDVPSTGNGPVRGEWYNFITLAPVTMKLPRGEVKLKLISNGTFINLDSFTIAPAQQSDVLFAAFDREHYRIPLPGFHKRERRFPPNGKIVYGTLRRYPEQLDAFLEQMSDDDLAQLLGGHAGSSHGSAGSLGACDVFEIPPYDTFDGPSGVRSFDSCTSWPCPALLAGSFDPELAETIGAALAREARLNRFDIWLAPGVNIHRNPLCGRNFEYLSEDPLLSGQMGAALARGAASENIAVTVKHFAANNREHRRFQTDSRISERALRDIYLRPFEIIVKEARPLFLMSSYNLLNGRKTAETPELLTGILRDEWKFTGTILSDWGNNSDHVYETLAGNTVKMERGNPAALLEAMRHGELTRGHLKRAAGYLVKSLLQVQLMREKQIKPAPDILPSPPEAGKLK